MSATVSLPRSSATAGRSADHAVSVASPHAHRVYFDLAKLKPVTFVFSMPLSGVLPIGSRSVSSSCTVAGPTVYTEVGCHGAASGVNAAADALEASTSTMPSCGAVALSVSNVKCAPPANGALVGDVPSSFACSAFAVSMTTFTESMWPTNPDPIDCSS